MIKKIFIDVETAGLDPKYDGLWNVAVIVDIDGVQKETLSLKFRPNPDKNCNQEALSVSGMTIEKLKELKQDYKSAFSEFIGLLDRHISKFDKKDKGFFVAYNASFDEGFIREWFLDNGNNYFGAYFWSGRIDVMSHALEALCAHRPNMINFKLGTVANELGVSLDGIDLHDALADIQLTRNVYYEVMEQHFFDI